MSLGRILLAILGVGILMMVHEYGHYVAARRFGMRVEVFSVGFGPTIWKKKPKGSDTTFQIGIIPFLAYVKIAGMNPFEPIAKDDKGSYANASLWGRIVTIAGGPMANYVLAVVLFFAGFMASGRLVPDETVIAMEPMAGSPAMAAGVLSGDQILSVGGNKPHSFEQIIEQLGAHAGEVVDLEVLRAGQVVHVKPVVGSQGANKGRIGVGLSFPKQRKMDMKETTWRSLADPPRVIYANVRMIGRVVSGREKNPEVGGVVRIVKEGSKAIAGGFAYALEFFAVISAGLVAINLLPIPALDGGRLMFLFYEAIARKRANEKVEAIMHSVALLMFLALFVVITINDLRPDPTPKPLPSSAPAPSYAPPLPPPTPSN
jgi:regulator of sigma E protease